MSKTTRREWLQALALTALASGKLSAQQQDKKPPPLSITEYEPKSMLHVKETNVARARFPVIDFHTHLSFTNASGQTEKANFRAKREEILPVMDGKNVRTMVNLTGGYGAALEENLNYWQKPNPDRFITFTEPWFRKSAEPGYSKFQAEQIERAAKLGAKGLKVLKTLGLFLREPATTGKLVVIDDRRFDTMWEACAAAKFPVAIHTSDPEAFFLPIDRFNERFEELNAHPDWSFHGRDFPGNRELHEARLRVVARHPKTQFVFLHVGNAEDLAWVSEWLVGIRTFLSKSARALVSLAASHARRESFLTGIRIASCSEPTPCLTATKLRSRFSASGSTRFITAFWKPKTNTSITLRRRFRLKAAGAFTDWACRKRF